MLFVLREEVCNKQIGFGLHTSVDPITVFRPVRETFIEIVGVLEKLDNVVSIQVIGHFGHSSETTYPKLPPVTVARRVYRAWFSQAAQAEAATYRQNIYFPL